ncbi:Transferase [Sesbania bispinosa]|nr:Transferase [Sesbania bispinosa]
MAVSITSSHTVIPSHTTPNDTVLLSESEQINAHNHAFTIYIYRPNHNPTFKIIVDTIRHSLSNILVHYYPLAGRLHITRGGRWELECNAKGVKLLEAQSTKTLDEYGDFEPNDTITELIPKVDYSEPLENLPLLFVQLTKFTCGGFCVGIAISNVLVDGISGTLFVDAWAKVARGGTLEDSEMPLLNRTVLRSETNFNMASPCFHHPEFKPLPLVLGDTDAMVEREKETTLAILKLTKDMVEKLRKKANEFMEDDNQSLGKRGRRPYSRYESIGAHIWRCACKARFGDHNQPTVVYIVAGTRNRLKPPLPSNYFGNATHPSVTPTSFSGDIVSKPLSYGAQKIREAIEVLTDEYLRSAFDFIGSQKNVGWLRPSLNNEGIVEAPFLGNPNLNIWSWISNMPMYGPDFGWGKPIYMGPGAVKGDGKAFIMPGPLDDGSLSIAIRLQTSHMEVFKEYFYKDI